MGCAVSTATLPTKSIVAPYLLTESTIVPPDINTRLSLVSEACAFHWVSMQEKYCQNLSRPIHEAFDLCLSSFDDSDIIVSLLVEGANRSGNELIFSIIRYILGFQFLQYRPIIKKLQHLGREHARLMISEKMLCSCSNALVIAIAQCSGEPIDGPIIQNWALLFRFAIDTMAVGSYQFVRGGPVRREKSVVPTFMSQELEQLSWNTFGISEEGIPRPSREIIEDDDDYDLPEICY